MDDINQVQTTRDLPLCHKRLISDTGCPIATCVSEEHPHVVILTTEYQLLTGQLSSNLVKYSVHIIGKRWKSMKDQIVPEHYELTSCHVDMELRPHPVVGPVL